MMMIVIYGPDDRRDIQFQDYPCIAITLIIHRVALYVIILCCSYTNLATLVICCVQDVLIDARGL